MNWDGEPRSTDPTVEASWAASAQSCMTGQEQQRGAVSQCSVSASCSPSLHCLPDPDPTSLPPLWLPQADKGYQSGRHLDFLWSGWGAGPHHPGFLFSLPVWGSCSQCGAWQGWGGCREGLNRDIPCTPDSPGSVYLTPQSLLPGMAYASHVGPAGDREVLGHSPEGQAGCRPELVSTQGRWMWMAWDEVGAGAEPGSR